MVLCVVIILASCKSVQLKEAVSPTLFIKDNLIPWSIVAFDSLERTPKQRIAMLKQLGFNQYAFGGRQQHIDTFGEEIRIARKENVAIKAVWLYVNLNNDSVSKLKPMSEHLFNTIEAHQLKTQIWVGFSPDSFSENEPDNVSFNKAKAMLSYLAKRANALGSTISLYNHGGWYGNPKNQIRLIKALPDYEIGVVYNFHHAHDHLDSYASDIELLYPYLQCVNLNGMRADGPKILQIGEGDLELKMIQKLLDLGYSGPFGILGHVKGGDPKVLLQKNYDGLQELVFNTN